MDLLNRILQVVLVTSWTLSLTLVSLFAGVSNNDFAPEVAAQVIASPETRVAVAEVIAHDITMSAPLLGEIPGVEQLIVAAMISPALDTELPRLVEHGVRARLGQDVGPIIVEANDVIGSADPLVSLAVSVIPPIVVEPAPSPFDQVISSVKVVAPVVMAAAAVSFLIVRQTCGRSRTAMLTGLAGLLAAAVLLAIPSVSAFGGILTATIGSAVVIAPLVAVLAGVSALVGLRGLLAHTGAMAYRPIHWATQLAAEGGEL